MFYLFCTDDKNSNNYTSTPNLPSGEMPDDVRFLLIIMTLFVDNVLKCLYFC